MQGDDNGRLMAGGFLASPKRHRSQEEAEDRKAWLSGTSHGHTITFEAWRSLGRLTPHNVPYRDPVTGSDQPSSPFPSSS
jgi:hypothetical protein